MVTLGIGVNQHDVPVGDVTTSNNLGIKERVQKSASIQEPIAGIAGCWLVPFRVLREAVRIALRQRFAHFFIVGLLAVLTRLETISVGQLGTICNLCNAA
jgi:hypothetical protein